MTASASRLPEVQSLLQRLESDEQLCRFFPKGGVAIYQVPLPEQGAGLRYDQQPNTWRVAPGERLFVIDSAPLGLLTKPTAIAVFGENSREPRLLEVGHWNLFINERVFPFWESTVLSQWAVHQDQP